MMRDLALMLNPNLSSDDLLRLLRKGADRDDEQIQQILDIARADLGEETDAMLRLWADMPLVSPTVRCVASAALSALQARRQWLEANQRHAVAVSAAQQFDFDGRCRACGRPLAYQDPETCATGPADSRADTRDRVPGEPCREPCREPCCEVCEAQLGYLLQRVEFLADLACAIAEVDGEYRAGLRLATTTAPAPAEEAT